MIDDYDDISQADLDRLEARREKLEKQKVSERQTLKAGLLCSDVVDDTLDLTEQMLKEKDFELKGEIVTVANKVAALAVNLQKIHMMRSGLLPPVSTNKDTQEKWENQAIAQYEREREARRQARGNFS